MSNGWSRKVYLKMAEPSEEDNRSDSQRILEAIGEREDFSHERVHMGLSALRELSTVCRESGWKVTAVLGYDGCGWEVLHVEPGNTTDCHYGLCADLGSTTIAMEAVDMRDGTVAGRVSVFNPQIRFGEDILTRIFFAKDHPEHLEELRLATVEGLSQAMKELHRKTGICVEECAALIIAGNTTMIHFLLGLDAFCVFQTPYAVQTLAPEVYRASELGLLMRGFVWCCPGRANYLGGDIISGMIATGLPEREGISVFLDIGTNGELVIGNSEFLVCGAGAAGPALEGGVVQTGMRAEAGAVDSVKITDGEIRVHTIGDAAAKGICGSGIVELLAELYLNGWMDLRGKLIPSASDAVIEEDDQIKVRYAPGLYFSEQDISEFLKTKAAAGTMVEYMMNQIGITMDDVDRFYVAGAFGTHISKEAGVTIGLYPDIPRAKIISPGNSSLIGGREMLLDIGKKEYAKSLVEKMEYIQFGAVDDFLHLMGAAAAFPHTDLERYPSVQDELKRRGRVL